MAESKPAVDFYESPRYLATVEAVPHRFATMFPGIDLLYFRAFRPELERRTRPFHSMSYAGHIDDLMAHGLLLPAMIQSRRRKLNSVDLPGGDSQEERDERFWNTQRRAKGRVEVCVHSAPGPLPALAPFGPDHWPFFESASPAREYCRAELARAADDVAHMSNVFVGGAAGVHLRPYGFRFHPDDQQRMQHLVAVFQGKLRAEIMGARIESLAEPALRLVGTDPALEPRVLTDLVTATCWTRRTRGLVHGVTFPRG